MKHFWRFLIFPNSCPSFIRELYMWENHCYFLKRTIVIFLIRLPRSLFLMHAYMPRNSSYISSCFKLWSLERVSSRFPYLFQTLSERRWRTVRIHVEVVPVVSWNIQECGTRRRRTKNIHTWKLTVYCNYLFIPGEHLHTRREKACAVWSFASTHVESTTSSRTVLYMVFFYCIRTQCVSLFHIKYKFTTHTMLEWTRQLFIE